MPLSLRVGLEARGWPRSTAASKGEVLRWKAALYAPRFHKVPSKMHTQKLFADRHSIRALSLFPPFAKEDPRDLREKGWLV
eukprot:89262-Rhodomonas_salina.2